MTVEMIMSLIGNGMFPICACISMAIFLQQDQRNYRTDIKEITQSHKEETEKLTEALADINMSMQKLIDKFDRKED